MKAAQISSYGGKDVMQTVDEVDKPAAGKGEVIVEVIAAGLNPFDWKVREGQAKDYIHLEFPAILGGDVSGKAIELGEGVEDFKIGQEVYGSGNAASGHGTFAEFGPVKASQLAPKPASLNFVEAGAAPLAATSAYQALVEHINLQPGQKILIHGGAGGIGSFAIQLAKHLGAYVATTVSQADVDFAKSLGADEAIDYRSQDFTQITKDYDAVFDNVGGETNQKSYSVLKPGGILVSMSAPADDDKVSQANIQYVMQSSRATTERLNKVAELFDSGALKVHIDKAFSLDEAADALEHLRIGHPRGKIVLRIKG